MSINLYMYSYFSFRNCLAVFILLIVNLLYCFKYSVLFTGYPFLVIPLYLAAFLFLLTLSMMPGHFSISFNNFIRFTAAAVIPAAMLIVVLFIPRLGNINRMPAIESWLGNFLGGEFPYHSHYTPSAYPVIFIAALPFYLLGNTGLLSLTGILLFIYFVFFSEKDLTGASLKLIIFLLSLPTMYELVTRSELLFTVMLGVLLIYTAERKLNPGKVNNVFILISLAAGIVLSTRSVIALLFLIYFLYKFRGNYGLMILYGVIACLVFAVILLPFYFWNPQQFNIEGPFALQLFLSNLPMYLLLMLFAAAAIAGFLIKDIYQFYFSGGILLFLAAAVSFLIRAAIVGFMNSLINDGYDIAYFIFCVPLLILSINAQIVPEKLNSGITKSYIKKTEYTG